MGVFYKHSRGFSLVEIFIMFGVVVLLLGLGVVGWKALNAPGKAAESMAASTTSSVEVITTKADLEAAEKSLDDLNFEDESASQAESQASL